MTATAAATGPLLPFTVLFLSGRGAVECSLVLAADAVSALGIAQARYAPAAGNGGRADAAAQDLGDALPGAECLAVYPGHQIGIAGNVFPNPARPAPAPASDQSRSRHAVQGRHTAAATAAWAKKRSDAIGQAKRTT